MQRIIALAIFIGFILSSAYVSFRSPQYSWDMLAYSAIYYQSQDWNETDIHHQVYDSLLTSKPKVVQKFLQQSLYETSCSVNTNYFFQQIPFYTIKPGYNLLVAVITAYTNDPIQSMTWISVSCYFLICITIWFWLQAQLKVIWATIAGVCIAALPALIEHGRIFTPDPLSTLLILFALYLLCVKQKESWSLLLILISIAVRPDNILYAIFVGSYIFYGNYIDKKKIAFIPLSGILLSVTMYFFIGWYYHSPGWKITFQHSVIDLSLAPVVWEKVQLTLTDYLRYVIQGFILFNGKWRISLFLFLLSFFSIRISKQNKEVKSLQYILASVMLIKFFAFPLLDDRFYMVQYIFVIIMVCIAILPNKDKVSS